MNTNRYLIYFFRKFILVHVMSYKLWGELGNLHNIYLPHFAFNCLFVFHFCKILTDLHVELLLPTNVYISRQLLKNQSVFVIVSGIVRVCNASFTLNRRKHSLFFNPAFAWQVIDSTFKLFFK